VITLRTRALLSKSEYGEDEFREIDGYHIHYVDTGKGTPVLLIPGSFSTYRTWNPIVPKLKEKYRLLALDYLGTGDSDKPQSGFRYTIGEQADWIAKLLRGLRLGKVHLVGASYGGAIVFNLAARYPGLVGKVVSIEGGILKPEKMPSNPMEKMLRYPVLGDLMIALIRTGWMNGIALGLIASGWSMNMTAYQKKMMLAELSFNARSASRVAWYWIARSPQTVLPFEEEAKRIAAPILYLAGGKSDFREMAAETMDFLRRYLPQSKIVVFENGVHELVMQKSGEVARAILEFLGK
jgi:pimeloyl-ACP methyl ester carboxylesterase